ncbi:MAG: hypothetical protein KF799_13105 [Bdellovibrionales bacterium]|nr:hypothetical protein [Bdellovibrionales bacterium]
MHKTKFQITTTVVVLSAMLVVIGCGDGKRKSRARVSRANQQMKLDKNGNPVNAPTNPSNDASKTAGTVPNADALKLQGEAEEKIAALWKTQQGNVGQNIDQLENGTYTLKAVASEVMIRKAAQSLWTRAAVVTKIEGGRLHDSDRAQTALDPNGTGDLGYAIEVPSSFEVQQPWSPKADTAQSYAITALVENKAIDGNQATAMTNKLAAAVGTRTAVALMAVLAGERTDVTGKQVALRSLTKSDDGSIHVELTLDDVKGDTTVTRNFIFTFGFVKKVVKTAQAEPATDSQPAALPTEIQDNE